MTLYFKTTTCIVWDLCGCPGWRSLGLPAWCGSSWGAASSCTEKETALLLKQFILLFTKPLAVYSQHGGAASWVMDASSPRLPTRKGCLGPV